MSLCFEERCISPQSNHPPLFSHRQAAELFSIWPPLAGQHKNSILTIKPGDEHIGNPKGIIDMGKKEYKPESGQEIATVVSNDENFLMHDTGGRRSGIDRRKYSHDIDHPERRSSRDRRSIADRRSSPHFKLYEDIERRSGFKALYQELNIKENNQADKPERNKAIAIQVLSGSSLNSQAVKYGISNERVRKLVHRHCKALNSDAYNNALADTQRLFGKHKKMPSIHFLRRYSEFFLSP